MDDFWTIIANAAMFYIVFKIGQISALVQRNQRSQTETQRQIEQIRITGQRPVITVEEINGIYYAYDGNDFLAQGPTPDELGRLIAARFPQRYHLARVEIKA